MNSKELLEKTGISRATLNNYISWGIVPKPDVLPPEPQDGAARRIGYFPDEVVKRIAEIQRLKSEGWSITRIAEHFAGGRAPVAAQAPKPAGAAEAPSPATERVAMGRLSIDDSAHPAYMVDHRFELVWFNAAAGASMLRNLSPGADSQNVFNYLVDGQSADADSREQILRFHLGLAKQLGVGLSRICRDLPPEDRGTLERLHNEVPTPEFGLVSHAWVTTPRARPGCLYAVRFREGILFVLVPASRAADDMAPLLLRRGPAAGDTGGGKRLPGPSHVAVLVADLQHAMRIWSELPPEEYFELINQIWLTMDPIFRRHHGTHGKHARDGMVSYFFPQRDSSHVWNALLAAAEMREAMRRVSKAWQLRKGWTTELYLNTGVDEGQQWLGTLQSVDQVEFTMLGDTLNRASRISDFARYGAIWATKNLIGKLTAEEKQRLKFGVRHKSSDGREIFVSSIFSSVDSLTDLAADSVDRLKDIARLPIAEIDEIAGSDRRGDRAVAQNPI